MPYPTSALGNRVIPYKCDGSNWGQLRAKSRPLDHFQKGGGVGANDKESQVEDGLTKKNGKRVVILIFKGSGRVGFPSCEEVPDSACEK